MTDQVFNIGLGRVAELYNRVDQSDPANAVLEILVLATAGLESDAVLKDKVTTQDLLSGATSEVTNTNYARKVLDDSDIVAFAPDQGNDRVDLDIPDQTYTNILAGDNWSRFVITYDVDSATGTDANIEPLTSHDFVVSPDGSDITAQINANGFYRAS